MDTRDRPRRARVALALGVVAMVVIALALGVFQPWRLFTDTVVDEASPFTASVSAPATATAPSATKAAEPGAAPTTAPAPTPESDGPRMSSFRSVAHPTAGTVTVGSTPTGGRAVFLEGLDTDNGPDLKVVLAADPGGDGHDAAAGLDLGPLKGNKGNQTYEVPGGTDLGGYTHVVIWCARFQVAFGVADLTAA